MLPRPPAPWVPPELVAPPDAVLPPELVTPPELVAPPEPTAPPELDWWEPPLPSGGPISAPPHPANNNPNTADERMTDVDGVQSMESSDRCA